MKYTGCCDCVHADLWSHDEPCCDCIHSNGDNEHFEVAMDFDVINDKLDRIMERLGIKD